MFYKIKKILVHCPFRWHRVALSVKGDSVTLLVDCEIKETLPLDRKPGSTFNLAGAIVVGVQVTPDQYYEVSANKSIKFD